MAKATNHKPSKPPAPIDARTMLDVSGLTKTAGRTTLEVGLDTVVVCRKERMGMVRVPFQREEWDQLAKWYVGR